MTNKSPGTLDLGSNILVRARSSGHGCAAAFVLDEELRGRDVCEVSLPMS